MPPFPDTILSDQDVRNISAWIATPGGEMMMAHEEETEGGHEELEMSSTEIAHLRLMLTSVEAGNTDDAIRHGPEPELLELAATI